MTKPETASIATINNDLKENSFDFLRYLFAFSVFFGHFSILTESPGFWPVPLFVAVRAFLTMSGFMVCINYLKHPDPVLFMKKRIYRIYPPYLFIICVGIILSLFVTRLPVTELITNSTFYRYIASNLLFLNFLQPSLPGVFEGNPETAINGSLWTMKVEFFLYATVPAAFWFFRKYNKTAVFLAIYTFSFIYSAVMRHYYQETGNTIYSILDRQFMGQLRYFYSGTFILFYFDYFRKYLKYLFPLAVILYLFRYHVILRYAEPLAFATLLIGFAYGFKYLNFLSRYSNISYGIYLFHFPVIQTLVHYNLHKEHLLFTFILAVAITLLLAVISWLTVEKYFLNKKEHLRPAPRLYTKNAISSPVE